MIAAVGSCQPIRAASGANSSRYNTGVNNTGVELVLRATVCSQPEEVNPSMPRKAQHLKDRPQYDIAPTTNLLGPWSQLGKSSRVVSES